MKALKTKSKKKYEQNKGSLRATYDVENDLGGLTLFPIEGVGEVKLHPLSHSNYLKNVRKYKPVWAVFFWLSIYIYLTYSEKFSAFRSSQKSGSDYFLGSTWKISKINNFVQISYFWYSCRVAVFWWKITFNDKVI